MAHLPLQGDAYRDHLAISHTDPCYECRPPTDSQSRNWLVRNYETHPPKRIRLLIAYPVSAESPLDLLNVCRATLSDVQ